MEQLFIQLCMTLQLNYNLPSNACSNSITAMYAGSKEKSEIESAQKYYEKRTYDILGKDVIYTGAGIGAIADAYTKKELRITAPLRPLCDSFTVDMKQDYREYGINWKFNW